jgi:hypothetical protein
MQGVWPDENGEINGLGIEPLHANVAKAAKQDKTLYKLLASIDILRVGRAREMKMVSEELKSEML